VNPLGDNLLPLLLLAFGGALFVCNLLAVVRPPTQEDGEIGERAPARRSLMMSGIGLLAAIWAIATLLSK
jgi:hypothetical protein